MNDDNGPAGVILPTACQIRAARAMLRFSVQEMSRESGVSERTIRRIESQWGVPNVQSESLLKLRDFFVGKGMTLLPEDGDPRGPGIRWGSYPGRLASRV